LSPCAGMRVGMNKKIKKKFIETPFVF